MRHLTKLAALSLSAIAFVWTAPSFAQQPDAGSTPEAAASAPVESAEAPKPVVNSPIYYVAVNGNDAWSGKLAEPNAEKSDGPFATLAAARDALRALRKTSTIEGSINVQVRGGLYVLSEPFSLQAEDSGTASSPVIFSAYPGEKPVFSGGKAITGWTQEGDVWKVALPEITTSDWRFHTIWVNGQRRGVCRTPNEGFFVTAGRAPATENASTGDKVLRSNTGFRYNEGDIKRWDNLDEALVVVLHAWETSFHHISAIDEENKIVTFRNAARWAFEDWGPEQRYYVLNTLDGMDVPGEWYVDRKTGVLSYRPMPGEDMTKAEVVAPFLKQLVLLDGNPSAGQYVQHVKFSGFSFYHANFAVGPEGYGDAQGAVGVPGAIQFRGVQNCALEGCEIAHVDTYGVWLRAGSFGASVIRNEFHDLGAGGVRVGEQQRAGDAMDALHNMISNNLIHDGGHVFRSGVGVWIGQSPLNTISHNDISDLSNSAITVGWAWGKEQGFSYSNLIEFNRIHQIGKGEFSNMAGVYLLHGSDNSIVRDNLIHNVNAYLYGGWGVHVDEGCSNLDVENNIVYNTTSGGYDQFFGNLNRVQNNVFAFSRDSQVGLSSTANPQPILFEKNIVVTDNGLPFGLNWVLGNIWQDLNCYWETNGSNVDFCGASFDEWQASGKDVHSISADPLFENIDARDFRLKADSPALALGIRSIDLSSAGLCGDPNWIASANALQYQDSVLSTALAVRPIFEDFESTPVGVQPAGLSVFGADGAASVKVTDEIAASGQKSLKVTDSEGPQKDWQPEVSYTPRFRDGDVTCSFDLRLETGASLQYDWRSDWTLHRVGPRLKINESGELSFGDDDKSSMTLPHGEWIHVEVECKLGKASADPATYNVAVTVAGQETKRFENLVCPYKKFRSVERIWFLSLAKKATVYYIDNVKLEQK
jgi:hypothetical protein